MLSRSTKFYLKLGSLPESDTKKRRGQGGQKGERGWNGTHWEYSIWDEVPSLIAINQDFHEWSVTFISNTAGAAKNDVIGVVGGKGGAGWVPEWGRRESEWQLTKKRGLIRLIKLFFQGNFGNQSRHWKVSNCFWKSRWVFGTFCWAKSGKSPIKTKLELLFLCGETGNGNSVPNNYDVRDICLCIIAQEVFWGNFSGCFTDFLGSLWNLFNIKSNTSSTSSGEIAASCRETCLYCHLLDTFAI